MRIFLDSGSPEDTREAMSLVPISGQTTNPTLIAKYIAKHPAQNAMNAYRQIVREMRETLGENASISIEVDASKHSTADQLFHQALQMSQWINNPHIKLPITPAGMESAERALLAGLRVNMTLCFSVEQALAVHTLCKSCTSEPDKVMLSPYMGRVDDAGESGARRLQEIMNALEEEKSMVRVLSASIRSIDHIESALDSGADIVTVPLQLLRQHADRLTEIANTHRDRFLSDENICINTPRTEHWSDHNIDHPLTSAGLAQFAKDWDQIET